MIRKIAITIIGMEEQLFDLYEHVKQDIYKPMASNCAYNGRGNLKVILDENSDSYKYLIDASKKYNLHPHIAQWVEYTKSEIENSEHFLMRIPAPFELEGTAAAYYGTQYAGGCPNCGLGGKPLSNVLVDRKFMKKYKIGNLYPDIYVSEELRELIISNNLTGISFDHEVKDYKGREMSKFFTLDIQHILPPMRDSTWLVRDEYPDKRYEECGHQVLYLRSDSQYEREKLVGARDFSLTNEFVDSFRIRQIIVSARVRRIFQQNKVYSSFFPVAIYDS